MQPERIMFPVEEIPNEDSLYYRIHKNDVIGCDVVPGAFRERGEGEQKGMSTDWSRYATPAESINMSPDGIIPINREATHGIISLPVGQVRAIDCLFVEHNPLAWNQAHAHILGIPPKKPSSTEVRNKLTRIYRWEIKAPA